MSDRHATALVLGLLGLSLFSLCRARGSDAPTAPAVELPSGLLGRPGEPRALHPSERLLARAPHVTVRRGAFGTSEVALVSVSGGVKELHPPAACLTAAGFEVVERRRLDLNDGCLLHLAVRRRDGSMHHFFQGYLVEGSLSCSYWQRVAASVGDALIGSRRNWSTLQVMDRDETRARRVAVALAEELRRNR